MFFGNIPTTKYTLKKHLIEFNTIFNPEIMKYKDAKDLSFVLQCKFYMLYLIGACK